MCVRACVCVYCRIRSNLFYNYYYFFLFADDEIDVVNVNGSDTIDLARMVSGYSSTFSTMSSTLSSIGTVKRGSKSGVSTARKVGRPCKVVKRLTNGSSTLSQSFLHVSTANTRKYSSVEIDPYKRSLHNSMERLRRVNLKNCFDAVRCAVPSLRDRARAPKVLILKSAADLIRNLEKSEIKKRLELEHLRLHHSALMTKLQKMKEDRDMG